MSIESNPLDINKKLDEIIDEKYQSIIDIIKSEIDQFVDNTREYQISEALRRYFS